MDKPRTDSHISLGLGSGTEQGIYKIRYLTHIVVVVVLSPSAIEPIPVLP